MPACLQRLLSHTSWKPCLLLNRFGCAHSVAKHCSVDGTASAVEMQYTSSVDEYTSQFRQRLHDAVSADTQSFEAEVVATGAGAQKPWSSLAAANRQRSSAVGRKVSPATTDAPDYPAPSDIFSTNTSPEALLTGDVPSVNSSPSGEQHLATASSRALDAHTAASIAQGFLDEYRAAIAKASTRGVQDESSGSMHPRPAMRQSSMGSNGEGMSLANPAELASADEYVTDAQQEEGALLPEAEAGEHLAAPVPLPAAQHEKGTDMPGQEGGKEGGRRRDRHGRHGRERRGEDDRGRRHRSSSRRAKEGGSRGGKKEEERRGKREGSRRRRRRDSVSTSASSSPSSHASSPVVEAAYTQEEEGQAQGYILGQGVWDGGEHELDPSAVLHMPMQGGQHMYPMPSLAQHGGQQRTQQAVVQDAAGSVRPQSDLVLVPIKALRDNAAALAEVESNMRAVQGEREGLLMRLEGMGMRVQQVEAQRDQQAQECARLRQALAGKDDMIALLQGQLMGAQGSVAQAAASAAVQAATATASSAAAHNLAQGPPPHLAAGGSSVSEEEFLLLSDEVGSLQGQLESAQRELEAARAQLSAAGHLQPMAGQQAQPLAGAYGPSSSAIPAVSPPAAAPGNIITGVDAPAPGTGLAAGVGGVGAFKGRQQGQQSYDDLSNENTRLKQQLAASGEEVAMLRSQATSTAAVRADMEQQLRSAQEQADKARSALDAARAQASESEREAKRTAANLATSEAEADKARRRAVEAESRGESLARSLEGTQHDLRAAHAALEEAHKAVAARNAEIQELREAVRAQNAVAQQARAEVEGSRAELHRARAEVDRLRGQLQQAQAQVQQLSAQVGMPAPFPPPGPARGSRGMPEATGLLIGGGGEGDRSAVVGGRGRVPQQQQQQQVDIEPSLSSHRPSSAPEPDYALTAPPVPYHQAQTHAQAQAGSSSSRQGSPGRYSHTQAQQVSLTDGRSRLFGASEEYGLAAPPSAPPAAMAMARRASTSSTYAQAQASMPGPMEPPYGVPSGGPRSPPRKGGVGVAARQLESSISWDRQPSQPTLQVQPMAPSPPRPAPSHAAAPPAQAQEAPLVNPYGRPTAAPALGPYGSASSAGPVPNPYGVPPVTAHAHAPQPAQNAAAAERARRMAMLADLAGGSSGRPLVQAPAPPPVPVGVQAGIPLGGSAYDAHAMAVLEAGEQYKRVRAQAVGDNGQLLHANQSSAETVRALPFGSEAARAVEEDLRAAAVARPSKEDADAQSKAREASAPFATEAAVQSLEAQIQSKEAQLLSANLAKTDAEAELKRLGTSGGGRTVRDRARKAELEGQLAGLEKSLAELRRWLKTHAP